MAVKRKPNYWENTKNKVYEYLKIGYSFKLYSSQIGISLKRKSYIQETSNFILLFKKEGKIKDACYTRLQQICQVFMKRIKGMYICEQYRIWEIQRG